MIGFHSTKLILIKCIIEPQVREYEWVISKNTRKRIDKIWDLLTPVGIKKGDMNHIGKSNIFIVDSKEQTKYLIFQDIIVKKSGKILLIKKDEKNLFHNAIFKTIPKCYKHELFNLIK